MTFNVRIVSETNYSNLDKSVHHYILLFIFDICIYSANNQPTVTVHRNHLLSWNMEYGNIKYLWHTPFYPPPRPSPLSSELSRVSRTMRPQGFYLPSPILHSLVFLKYIKIRIHYSLSYIFHCPGLHISPAPNWHGAQDKYLSWSPPLPPHFHALQSPSCFC